MTIPFLQHLLSDNLTANLRIRGHNTKIRWFFYISFCFDMLFLDCLTIFLYV